MTSGVGLSLSSAEVEVRFFEVQQERDAVALAIEITQRQLLQARIEESRTVARDLEAAWNKNISSVCDLILKLQKLGEERSRLHAEWSMRTGLDIRPARWFQADKFVPGKLLPDSAPYALLQHAARVGII